MKYELGTFAKLLKELNGVLDWHEFSALRPATLKSAQRQVQQRLQEGVVELKRELPQLAEALLRDLGKRLPEKQRKLAKSFNEQLTQIMNQRVGSLGRQISEDFSQLIGKDLPDPKQVERINKIATVFQWSAPEYFDPKGAALGAVAGVGLVAVVGLALPVVGAALLGAALASSAAGGVLGGFLGSGTTLVTVEQLRERVARPAVIDAQTALDGATQRARAQLDSFCEILHRAVSHLSKPESQGRDLKAMHGEIQAAQGKLKGLRKHFSAVQPKTEDGTASEVERD